MGLLVEPEIGINIIELAVKETKQIDRSKLRQAEILLLSKVDAPDWYMHEDFLVVTGLDSCPACLDVFAINIRIDELVQEFLSRTDAFCYCEA